jgi:hypothetical protein
MGPINWRFKVHKPCSAGCVPIPEDRMTPVCAGEPGSDIRGMVGFNDIDTINVPKPSHVYNVVCNGISIVLFAIATGRFLPSVPTLMHANPRILTTPFILRYRALRPQINELRQKHILAC